MGWREGVGTRRGVKWRGHSDPTGGSGTASWYTYLCLRSYNKICQYIIVPIAIPLTCHSHSQSPPVFLYDCSSAALSRDCSECVSLPPELSCGYCSSPTQCLHSSFCNAPSTFIESQQDTGQCPVHFEVSWRLTQCVCLLSDLM